MRIVLLKRIQVCTQSFV